MQSISLKARRRSPVSQPVSAAGWKIQKSVASSQTRRGLSSGPRVNKDGKVRGNWMQASASHCVLITEERNNAQDFCGRHQKQRFNQNPETRCDNIQIATDWKCFSSHDETQLISIMFGLCLHVTLKGNHLMMSLLPGAGYRGEGLGCQERSIPLLMDQ